MQRDVRDLLEEGERIEREVDVGSDRLVVTNRRLLAFTPEGPGKNYRHVERPNVQRVGLARRSRREHVVNGVAYLGIGLAVAGVGWWLETDGLLSSVPTGPGASALGVGSLIGQMAYWLGLVDDGIVALGVLITLPAAYHAVSYLRSRQSVLAVEVAGEENIDLPTDRVEDPNGAVERLRLALDLPTGEASETSPEWSAAR